MKLRKFWAVGGGGAPGAHFQVDSSMPFGYCATNLMENTKYLTFEDKRVIQILWKLSTITCTLLKTIGNLSSK